jgi:hypothetical protein
MDKNERGLSSLRFLSKEDAKLQNKCVDRTNSCSAVIFEVLAAMTEYNCLLECNVMQSGSRPLPFRRNLLPPSSGLKINGTKTPARRKRKENSHGGGYEE